MALTPSIRDCRIDEAQAVLELWRRAEATVSATDTLPDVHALIEAGPVRSSSPSKETAS